MLPVLAVPSCCMSHFDAHVSSCDCQDPCAVGSTLRSDCFISNGTRTLQLKEATLCRRAFGPNVPRFPDLRAEMATSPTAVARAAATQSDRSWILAAVDVELTAGRRVPPPAVHDLSLGSCKRLRFE